jgi:methylated-DNA-[protein]-cysteine S-methyltransferase
MKTITHYSMLKTTSLGTLLLTADENHLTGIYFEGCDHAPASRSQWQLDPGQKILAQAKAELEAYFKGTRTRFSIPLRFAGTGFQQRVWREIALIPFGQTITYSELASRAGAPDAIRAVGTATGRNPISIVVPCHRVIGKNGSLTGYAGGLERKRCLLSFEQRNIVLTAISAGAQFAFSQSNLASNPA